MIGGILFSLIIKGIAYLVSLFIAEGIMRSVVTFIVTLILAVLGYFAAERESSMTEPINILYVISVGIAVAFEFGDEMMTLKTYLWEMLKGVFL